MTTPKKFILAGVLLAGVSALAMPTFAAQFSGPAATEGSQATGASGGQQVAFNGGWGQDGPRHWRHMGPGGPGGHGGPGGPGPRFHRGAFMYDRMLELLGIDADSGKVTRDQIDAAVDAKFKSYDKNGDGKITLDEYQAFWNDLTHERMVRSFQRLDREGSGAVTLQEVQKPLDRVLSRLDRNDDGVIDKADFQRPHRPWGKGPGGPQGGPGGPGQPPAETEQ
jgi:Ca2+-binding EF-hand superfamily protein